jgi:hypothetical protein
MAAVSTFYDQMRDLDESLDEALAAIRAQEAENNITSAEAASERCAVLENHIAACRQLRQQHQLDGES